MTNFSAEILYSPRCPHVDDLLSSTAKHYPPHFNISSSLNSSELENEMGKRKAFAGVEFPDYYAVSWGRRESRRNFWNSFFQNLTTLPDNIEYNLRFPGELRQTNGEINPLTFNWRTNFLFQRFQSGGARNYKAEHDGVASGYYVEGQ